MNTATIRPFALALSTVLALAGSGRSQDRSATFALSYGTSEFGGSVTMNAFARRTSLDSVGSYESAIGASDIRRVRVFGQSKESAAIVAGYTVRQVKSALLGGNVSQTRSGSFVVRIAGITVQQVTAATSSTWSEVFAPGNVFAGSGVSQSVGVGPFAMSVRANVSAGARFDLTRTTVLDPGSISYRTLPIQFTPPSVSASLTGWARASANGSASASLAVPGVSFGVSADLVFANSRADLLVEATSSRLGGALTYAVEPIDLELSAYATVYPPLVAPITYRTTLVDWSLGSRSGSLPIQ
ncbi:MAG: hypothetical protein IT457_08265 [Planctomycetes bacterium]|nr:hypothetical protein [Planctomycetota bacterium]